MDSSCKGRGMGLPSQWFLGTENTNKECDVRNQRRLLKEHMRPLESSRELPTETLSEVEVSYKWLREKSRKSELIPSMRPYVDEGWEHPSFVCKAPYIMLGAW